MYKLMRYSKYLESRSNSESGNFIHVPELDIYEQMQFLFDIVSKDNVSVEYTLYRTKDGKQTEHNFKDNFSPYISNGFIYNLTILISCEQYMNIDEFISASTDLEDFCEHLQASIGDDYKVHYKIRHARSEKLIFYTYIIDMKHSINVCHDREKLLLDLKNKLPDYKFSVNYENSLKISPTNFMFNNVNKKEIRDVVKELEDKWNIRLFIESSAAYVELRYPIGDEFLKVKKNFGLEDEN